MHSHAIILVTKYSIYTVKVTILQCCQLLNTVYLPYKFLTKILPGLGESLTEIEMIRHFFEIDERAIGIRLKNPQQIQIIFPTENTV